MKRQILQLLSGNFISKVLGFIRELLLSRFFGTGEINGAYRIAQTGTLVPINFLTSDSLNSAFIPLYKKYLLENEEKARTFKWMMYIVFLCISLIVWIGIYFFSDFWVTILAPGVDARTKLITKDMLEVMALCTPFYLCSAIINYVSMAHNDFVPMSMRAIVQNLGMLLGVFAAYYLNNYKYLAWGFTGSYIFFCFWAFARKDSTTLFSRPTKFTKVNAREVFGEFGSIMKPLLLLPFILQGNIALERSLSSLISIDAVSGLDYARFITDTINFFVAIPIAFAGLSNWASSDISKTKNNLININRLLIFFGCSCSFFIYINAEDIVSLLFKHGKFDNDSVVITANYLRGMAIGLWAQLIGYIFIKALNAHMQNKKVLMAVSLSVLVNIAGNLLLYKKFGAYGIGIGASLNGLILYFFCSTYLGIINKIIKPLIIMVFILTLYSIIYITLNVESYFHTNHVIYTLIINFISFYLFVIVSGFFFKEFRMVYSIIKVIRCKISGGKDK